MVLKNPSAVRTYLPGSSESVVSCVARTVSVNLPKLPPMSVTVVASLLADVAVATVSESVSTFCFSLEVVDPDRVAVLEVDGPDGVVLDLGRPDQAGGLRAGHPGADQEDPRDGDGGDGRLVQFAHEFLHFC